jgi:outer membrane protein assembly factor BamB
MRLCLVSFAISTLWHPTFAFCGFCCIKNKSYIQTNNKIILQNKRRKGKKMTFLNKTTAVAIAMFLIISMGASMTLIPSTSAHTPPYQIKTYAKVVAMPDPIGVGQSALVYAFLGNAPLSGSAITNTFRNHNYTVTITGPNGTIQTFHWDTVEDTTGVQYFRFTPTEVGDYTLVFVYGGNVVNSTWFDTTSASSVGDIWLPSTATDTLTVQAEPATTYPNSYPMPTEYWTRPIYGENQDWFTISSNWFGIGSPALSDVSYGTILGMPSSGSANQRYPGDAVGSLTSHVMWTKPLQEGGVVGGNRFLTTGDTYFEGSAYNNRYSNPIIMYGRIFYRDPVSYSGGGGDSVCVDLRTGQEIWRRTDLPTISFGFTFDVQTPNQHGVYPAWLCTSNFGQVFDMYTGQNVFNVTGSAPGFLVSGPIGEYLKYNIFNNATIGNDYYLCVWNSSNMFTGTGFASGTGLSPAPDTNTYTSSITRTWQNTTVYINNVLQTQSINVTTTTRVTAVNATIGKRYNWLDPYTQNVSLPWRNNMTTTPTVLAVKYGDMMLLRNGSYPSLTGVRQNTSGTVYLQSANWTYFAVNLNPSKPGYKMGDVLWWGPTNSHLVDETITFGGFDPTAQVLIEVSKETQNIWGYSTKNGALLWETNKVNSLPQQDITPLDYFGNPYFPYYATQTAYGNVYSLAYGGVLYCYNLTTGKRTWSNGNGHTPGNDTDTGTSVPGYYPSMIQAVGNGVIYVAATEHTTITPISKGEKARAINATDGTEIWSISDYTGEFSSFAYAMADGYCNWFNGYDNQIYTVGRGPSATLVSAPDVAAAFGEPVVIKGTVMDIAAGTKQNEQAARFPSGVPAVSDASMTDWMGYIYQQKPIPMATVGVKVTLSVLDSNGNFRDIGTVTTDSKGFFSYTWVPEIPGDFTVYATFDGTAGYWPSSAETAFTVMEQPEATPAPTASPAPMTDSYVAGFGIALIVILVAGIVVIVLILRRK